MLTMNKKGNEDTSQLLTVMLTAEDGGWFAQGLEIDYAACGATLEEAKENFAHGLVSTMTEHMKMHESLKHFLVPASPEVWNVYYEAKKNLDSVQSFEDVQKKEGCFSLKAMFPFQDIAFFDPVTA
ncbi:MAG: hypothetical protein K2P74_04445 [Nitrosomonas sp.]|nr:hypothetical protein [Nitrosomonas sp.]